MQSLMRTSHTTRHYGKMNGITQIRGNLLPSKPDHSIKPTKTILFMLQSSNQHK